MPDDGDNLLSFDPGHEIVISNYSRSGTAQGKCRHRPMLYPRERIVKCSVCNLALDPFQVLLDRTTRRKRVRRIEQEWKSLEPALDWLITKNRGRLTMGRAGITAAIQVDGKWVTRKGPIGHAVEAMAGAIRKVVPWQEKAAKDAPDWMREPEYLMAKEEG